MTNRPNDPLFGDVPDSIPLKNAPLVRVLGQVRFAHIAKISDESYIANFQEKIRATYPHFQNEQIQSIELNVSGDNLEHKQINSVIWRFFDPEKIIRVSLAPDAISLETAYYISREDFLERFEKILIALHETINPTLVERVGYRYLDRIQGADQMNDISELVQTELLNVLQPELFNNIDYAMTEIHARTKEGILIAKYGKAPPNFSHDPNMAPPVPEISWVLDVDSSCTFEPNRSFDTTELRKELGCAAGRAYSFFRWSITEEFLKRFGVDK